MSDIFSVKREAMVREQIEARGVRDERVLRAMRTVKRHLFVPEDMAAAAYYDEPLPIGRGQTISQPYIVAYMTETADLSPEDRVLEIGTGSGYQSAILSLIVKEVFTIEVVDSLAAVAAKRFSEMNYNNIKIKTADGYHGWPEMAPFDAIIITAAPPEVPEELISQLKPGSKMVVPVGEVFQELRVITRTQKGYEDISLMPVRFVPMVRHK